jgi:hypothetical protein
MIKTFLQDEVGSADLGDIFDDEDFKQWALEEMEEQLESKTKEYVYEAGGVKTKRDVRKGAEKEVEKGKIKNEMGSLELRLRQVENGNKELVNKCKELAKESKELKDRIEGLESYTAALHERDQILFQRRSEELTRKARYLEEDEKWAAKYQL